MARTRSGAMSMDWMNSVHSRSNWAGSGRGVVWARLLCEVAYRSRGEVDVLLELLPMSAVASWAGLARAKLGGERAVKKARKGMRIKRNSFENDLDNDPAQIETKQDVIRTTTPPPDNSHFQNSSLRDLSPVQSPPGQCEDNCFLVSFLRRGYQGVCPKTKLIA